MSRDKRKTIIYSGDMLWTKVNNNIYSADMLVDKR